MMGVSDWAVQIWLFKEKFFRILNGKVPKRVRACHKLPCFSFSLLFIESFLKSKFELLQNKKIQQINKKSKFEPGFVGQ